LRGLSFSSSIRGFRLRDVLLKSALGEVAFLVRVLTAFMAAILTAASLFAPVPCYAAPNPGPLWDNTLDNLEDSGMTKSLDQVYREVFGDSTSWREVVRDILSGNGIDLRKLSKALSETMFGQVLSHTKLLGRIVLTGVVIACLKILIETISPEGSARVALFASHMALVTLAALSFMEVLAFSPSSRLSPDFFSRREPASAPPSSIP